MVAKTFLTGSPEGRPVGIVKITIGSVIVDESMSPGRADIEGGEGRVASMTDQAESRGEATGTEGARVSLDIDRVMK